MSDLTIALRDQQIAALSKRCLDLDQEVVALRQALAREQETRATLERAILEKAPQRKGIKK